MKQIILEEGIHFTPPGLVNYLNERYSKKIIAANKTYKNFPKTSFNSNDVHQYIKRGKLPSYIEANTTLREIYIPFLGKKIIELRSNG